MRNEDVFRSRGQEENPSASQPASRQKPMGISRRSQQCVMRMPSEVEIKKQIHQPPEVNGNLRTEPQQSAIFE